jgi:hypothetical protein
LNVVFIAADFHIVVGAWHQIEDLRLPLRKIVAPQFGHKQPALGIQFAFGYPVETHSEL